MTDNTQPTNPADVAADAANFAADSLKQTMGGISRATAGFEQTRAHLLENAEAAARKAADAVRFGQGNIEALTKSAQIWMTGVQDLSKQVAASFQSSVQETTGAFKTLSTVKSLREAFDLQCGYARTAMEQAIAESGRLTQASLQLTEQALAPVAERVRLGGEIFAKAA